MDTMTSEKQRNAGWILPDQIDGHDLVCLQIPVPNVREYRAAVWGAIKALTEWWNWEKGGKGDTRATRAAAYWRELFADLEITLECGDMGLFDVRQNLTSPCTLEKTDDNGASWEQWANLRLCAPRIRSRGGVIEMQNAADEWIPVEATLPSAESGDTFPQAPPRTESTEEDRRCLAAANAAYVLKVMHFEAVENFRDDFIGVTLGAVISSIALFIFFPPSLAVTLPIFTPAAAILGGLTFADFTTEIEDELRCILYTHSTDSGGQVTFAHGDILTAVFAHSGDMWLVLWYYLSVIQSGGLNLAGATTAITEAECADCADCTPVTLESPWTAMVSSAHGYNDASINTPNIVWRGEYIGYVSPIGYTTQVDVIIDLGKVQTVASVSLSGAATGIANVVAIMSSDGSTLIKSINPSASYDVNVTVTPDTPYSTRYLWLRMQATSSTPDERHVWIRQAVANCP